MTNWSRAAKYASRRASIPRGTPHVGVPRSPGNLSLRVLIPVAVVKDYLVTPRGIDIAGTLHTL